MPSVSFACPLGPLTPPATPPRLPIGVDAVGRDLPLISLKNKAGAQPMLEV